MMESDVDETRRYQTRSFQACRQAAWNETFGQSEPGFEWNHFLDSLPQNKGIHWLKLIVQVPTIIKNSTRSVVEYWPAVAQEWLQHHMNVMRGKGETPHFTWVAWAICFAIKHTMKCLLAPILSFKEAWNYSDNPWVRGFLCSLSVILNISLTIAVCLLAAPALAIVLPKAVASIPGLNFLGEKTPLLFNVGASPAQRAVSATFGLFWSMILVPVYSLYEEGKRVLERHAVRALSEWRSRAATPSNGRGVTNSEEKKSILRNSISPTHKSETRVQLTMPPPDPRLVKISEENARWVARFAGQIECPELPYPFLEVDTLRHACTIFARKLHPDTNGNIENSNFEKFNNKRDVLNTFLLPGEKVDFSEYNNREALKNAFDEGKKICEPAIKREKIPDTLWLVNLPDPGSVNAKEVELRRLNHVAKKAEYLAEEAKQRLKEEQRMRIEAEQRLKEEQQGLKEEQRQREAAEKIRDELRAQLALQLKTGAKSGHSLISSSVLSPPSGDSSSDNKTVPLLAVSSRASMTTGCLFPPAKTVDIERTTAKTIVATPHAT